MAFSVAAPRTPLFGAGSRLISAFIPVLANNTNINCRWNLPLEQRTTICKVETPLTPPKCRFNGNLSRRPSLKSELLVPNFSEIRRGFFRFPFSSMTNPKVDNFKVKGLTGAPITPLDTKGDVNVHLIPDYVQHFVDFGVPNAFVTGTNGEGNSLTVAERKLVAEAWVKHGKSRMSNIIIHIGAGNIKDSQELARHAESIGADAIACVGPTYHKPESLEQYVFYMRDVAAVAPNTPFLLYDIDFVTGIPFAADDFFLLATSLIPTLKGTKHTSPNLTSMANILSRHGDKYQILMGTDEIYLEGLSLGIEATICSSYLGNVLNRVKEAYDRGDIVTARKEQQRAVEVMNIRRKYNVSIPGFTKAVLRVLGLAVGDPRTPLKPITDSTLKEIDRELVGIGFKEWGL